MRSRVAVSLSYISLLCMLEMPNSLPLPSPNILLLPTPREPPEKEKHRQERQLTNTPSNQSPNEVQVDHLTLQREKRRAPQLRPVRLMRVGCALGTCQVHNLNYRLWQLVGQQGKEQSPIHLNSPHSYG
ncbi:ADM2 [Pelobates cultripes]|uniref:ADM2 n=1 Tax=Pelobates cultripes TaxID=61616 RepID=A0AAD1VZ31_PELCU|nr:ADM2 [Pelobates cultripes]